jgi:hypothetical protein
MTLKSGSKVSWARERPSTYKYRWYLKNEKTSKPSAKGFGVFVCIKLLCIRRQKMSGRGMAQEEIADG